MTGCDEEHFALRTIDDSIYWTVLYCAKQHLSLESPVCFEQRTKNHCEPPVPPPRCVSSSEQETIVSLLCPPPPAPFGMLLYL